jgi:asparagine synthase (glutamine-hydrolysing)
MCGIAGFVSRPTAFEGAGIEATKLMTDYMRPRGPDAEGLRVTEGAALGHRRLAILDLDSRANQPMVSNDGRYTIVFNGEIYNFRELRRTLEAEGLAFRTTSDTEVLLALFEREGARMLRRLRGMFGFAIWDTRQRELFLARDPYGIKPLYYARTKSGLLFASQVKALLASGLVSVEREPAGVAGFYLWGSVPEPWTLFRDAFALPAGHWLRVRDGVPGTPVCWFDIREHWRARHRPVTATELGDRVRTALTDAVRAHLVADVPVSVFLSSGVDSATLAGLAAGLGVAVDGITIGFEEFAGQPEDEVPVAAAVAAHYGLRHHVRRVSRAEFDQDIPRILQAMDQPSVDGVNTWFASKAAAEKGFKVVLSGVGGDELFRGYSLFSEIPRAVAVGRAVAAVPGARTLLSAPCAYLAKARSQPKLAGVPSYMSSVAGMYFLRRGLFLPGELPALMGPDRARDGLARLAWPQLSQTLTDSVDDAAAVGLLESTLYLRNQLLRDSDWASMAHSLELRTPLVDSTLLEALGPYTSGFADGVGKAMIAQSPKKPLLAAVVNRPKTGFGIPMEQWLSAAAQRRDWSDLPMLAMPGSPWARSWARAVLDGMPGCE